MKTASIKTYPDMETALQKKLPSAKQLCLTIVNDLIEISGKWTYEALSCLPLPAKYYRGIDYNTLKQWSDTLEMRPKDLRIANLSYELSQFASAKFLGCTAVVLLTKEYGPVHVRNMDWPIPQLGKSTIVIDNDTYVTVTVPGLYGMLSGMVPGIFSVTLNWMPPNAHPTAGWSPLGLLRWTLEHCKSYEQAATELVTCPLNSYTSYTLAGTKHACIIERTPTTARIVYPKHNILVSTNYYQHAKNKHLNSDKEFTDYQRDKANSVRTYAENYLDKPLKKLHRVLCNKTALLDETTQQMLFTPREGYYEVNTF